MSRIGKKPILLPTGVDATVAGSSVVVKGPKGTVTVMLHPAVTITAQADPKELVLSVAHPDTGGDKALWGLTRQLIANAVQGVQTPFEKSLEFVGVGFKVALAGRTLKMDVGFSHSVSFELPAGIEAKIDKQIVTVTGVDKQMVGETAARIRRTRPPEPYKGKGIKYTTETVRRKAGKTAAKAGA